MRGRKAVLVVLSVLLGTCNQAIMVAPPNSTMEMFANPTFIAAHGDVSQISALVMDGTGQPVPDGTVVQFFTNLGRIQEQGKTNDGVVRVNLISDSRSGQATVTAVSGGAATGPGPGPSPTPTPGSFDPGGGLASALSVSGASAVSAAQVSDSVTVDIGSGRPHTVIVTASAPRITTGGGVAITARVFDERGNPVANVPVIFEVTATTNGVIARLDSGGREIFTDNNGQATDILRTNSIFSGEVEVTATTPTGQSDTVSVQVN